MNGLTVFGLTLLTVAVLFALLRIERRVRWLVWVLLIIPAVIAVSGWAAVGGHWAEVLLGVSIAAGLTLAWWLVWGRRMAPASSDSIKVWGQEGGTKTRAQETAAMQAEILRLNDEKAQLEAEVRRLRAASPKPKPANGDKPAGEG